MQNKSLSKAFDVASLIDRATRRRLLSLLGKELKSMTKTEAKRPVDRLMLVDLNRRLNARNISDLLPANVVFSGVEVYDNTKVRILLRQLNS